MSIYILRISEAPSTSKAEGGIFGGNGVPGNDFNTVPGAGVGRKGETRGKSRKVAANPARTGTE